MIFIAGMLVAHIRISDRSIIAAIKTDILDAAFSNAKIRGGLIHYVAAVFRIEGLGQRNIKDQLTF